MRLSVSTIEDRWNRIDEDRWITASITTLIFTLIAFLLLTNIEIPESPDKVIPPEIIEFVPEVKKKVVKKKVKEIVEKVEEEQVEEDIEITLELFKSKQQKIPELSENLPISDVLRKFEKENPELQRSSALTQLTKGYMYEPSETEPMNIIEGLQSADESDNIRAFTINPNPARDKGIYESEGISTRIVATDDELSNDFSGFSGQISWEDWIDPILEWIKNHPSEIYEVAKLQMNVQQFDNTAKTIIKIGNKRYELLLASKPGKRQLTICLISLEDDSYTMLIDQGLKKTSNYFNIGSTRREQNEVIEFRGTTKPASDPKAKEFTKIFWQWAKKVTTEG